MNFSEDQLRAIKSCDVHKTFTLGLVVDDATTLHKELKEVKDKLDKAERQLRRELSFNRQLLGEIELLKGSKRETEEVENVFWYKLLNRIEQLILIREKRYTETEDILFL